MIIFAAPRFAHAANEVARVTGLGGTFVGTTLVALSTSLPELVASITAIRMKAFDLAVANLFGSNALNMAMFIALDLANGTGPIFTAVSTSHALSALIAMAMMATGHRGDRVPRAQPLRHRRAEQRADAHAVWGWTVDSPARYDPAMTTENDSHKILEALRSGGELPFPHEAVEKARTILRDPAYARAAELEALPDELALAVLDATVHAGVTSLADVLSGSAKKPLAKAAKKALYQLRSKGVAVPEKKQEPTPAPAGQREELPPSLVSAITGNGERALIVGRPVRGRIETLQMVIADEHGIVHLGIQEISRGQYRKLLKDANRPGTPSAVEIPLDHARELVAEATGTNLRSKTPFPEGLELALHHLGVTSREHPRPLPQPEPEDQGLASRGASLHEEPEIAQWLPPIDALRQLALKAEEIATSSLYVDENQRAQQLRHTIQTMAETFFTEPTRQLYARRLWHMADLFDRSDRPEQARIARAEARRLFHGAPGLFSPFGVKLFEKVLALSGPQFGVPLAEGPEAQASTAPTREEDLAQEKTSPGGLILP